MTLEGDKTALIVIDPQVSFCDQGGSMDRQGRDLAPLQLAVTQCDLIADHARNAGATIIWTRMVFAPGYTDGGELTNRIRPNLAKIGALERGSGDEELSLLVSPRHSIEFASQGADNRVLIIRIRVHLGPFE